MNAHLLYCSNTETYYQLFDSKPTNCSNSCCKAELKKINNAVAINMQGAAAHIIEIDKTELTAQLIDASYDRNKSIKRRAGYPLEVTIMALGNSAIKAQ